NTTIDEVFVPAAGPELPEAERFPAWRRDLLDRLRRSSFAAWPATAPEVVVSPPGDKPARGTEATENNMQVSWHWLPGKAGARQRWVVVLNPGEEAGKLPEWARGIVGDASVLILSPRGVGPGAWGREDNTVERSMALLGGTVDGGRVWDV